MRSANHFFTQSIFSFFSFFLCCFLVLFLFTILISCNEQPADPDQQIKSPFEMTWTSDTLAYPGSLQTNMTSIWGSSANDIWVCGHNDRSVGNLWHFTGYRWEAYNLFNDIPSSANSLFKVFGFSANNIWVVGNRIYDEYKPERTTVRKSLVLQYDGVRWKEHNLIINGWINDVWGRSPNDIWVSGWGIVSNFNGSSWKSDTLEYFTDSDRFQLNDYREISNGQYMMGAQLINSFVDVKYYFFKNENSSWHVKDSIRINSSNGQYKFGFNQYTSGDNTLYSFSADGIYEFQNEKWERIKQTFSPIYSIIKLSRQNILAVGDFGQSLFYDGTGWHQIQKLYDPKTVYKGVWSNGKEIFIIGLLATESPQKTIVWHGK